MAREGYQQQLDELREDVLYMSEVVLERQRQALTALEEKDDALAESVIEGDGEINRMYLDLESDCIDLFALQQPVAGDLRFIAASFKIITDLERIGDLATNLGRYAIDAQRDVLPDVDVRSIGDQTAEMVEDAMTAYEAENADSCFEIAQRDNAIDEGCESASETVIRDLLERDQSTAEIETILREVRRLLLTVRDLERVGDHAVNIAARTLYMVENDDALLY